MRQIFKVEHFEKNGETLHDMYRGDDLESEVRKMLAYDIWYFLDTLSFSGKEIIEHSISHSSYINNAGFVCYSAIVSVKYMSSE